MSKQRSLAISKVAHYALKCSDKQSMDIDEVETSIWQMLINIDSKLFSDYSAKTNAFVNEAPLSIIDKRIKENANNVAIIDMKDFYINLINLMIREYYLLPTNLEKFFIDLYDVFVNKASHPLDKLSARTCLRMMYRILSNNNLYKIEISAVDHQRITITELIHNLVIKPLLDINALQANYGDLLIVDSNKLDDCLRILESNFKTMNITVDSKVLSNHDEIIDYSKVLHNKIMKIVNK